MSTTPTKAKKPVADPFAAAKAAILKKLKDPGSAQFSGFSTERSPALGDMICGMVNAKNGYGGYAGARGFIYYPARSKAVMIMSGDTDDEYEGRDGANYCRFCLADGDKTIEPYCQSLQKSYP